MCVTLMTSQVSDQVPDVWCLSTSHPSVFPRSGIGLALCERLLSHDAAGLQLCLACRNMQRAQAARSALLASHPMAQVALLQMDTSSVSSVIAAAQEVKLRWEAVRRQQGCSVSREYRCSSSNLGTICTRSSLYKLFSVWPHPPLNRDIFSFE